MRLNTLEDYPQTADVWEIVSQDANSGQFFYDYKESVNVKMVSRPDDNSQVAICSTALTVGNQLRAVKDANGIPLNERKRYTVNKVLPVTNVFGFLEGHTYVLADGGFDS